MRQLPSRHLCAFYGPPGGTGWPAADRWCRGRRMQNREATAVSLPAEPHSSRHVKAPSRCGRQGEGFSAPLFIGGDHFSISWKNGRLNGKKGARRPRQMETTARWRGRDNSLRDPINPH
ncbi:Hypothetical protein NTJ_04179 [Nesidiocoris tenuis]|uniref:Uncharacterized protein n=1 Tax=Nesidiocoris tenuis TaxID=355587 RepID=A0ABN7AGI5_9HEMI|nr:Hypothetical protein NTJ_04179 [Nesidiocoris tenuis]